MSIACQQTSQKPFIAIIYKHYFLVDQVFIDGACVK